MSPIIFITNYEEMMSLTCEYKLEALDFIIKQFGIIKTTNL